MTVPSPVNAPDLFVHMAPIVSLRGQKRTERYYQKLLAELRERQQKGIGAIKTEKFRILWDNIAIWFNVFDLFTFFSDKHVCCVVSTYADAWSGDWQTSEDPMDALARIYQHAYLNLTLKRRAELMSESVRRYGIHGIVMHSDRSCKPYSLGQSVILELNRNGRPEAVSGQANGTEPHRSRRRVNFYLILPIIESG